MKLRLESINEINDFQERTQQEQEELNIVYELNQ